MKFILFMVLVMGISLAEAQQISVQSFRKLENDLSARTEKRVDQNGDICAIVKVVAPEQGFYFDGDGNGIVAVERKIGEYWVYVPYGSRYLTVKHDKLGVLRAYAYKERIDKALVFVNNGDNLGQALSKTKLDFPDAEIIGDLKIYSEMDNFEEALENLANNWLDESAYVIEQKASVLNMVALLMVSGVIAWAVMGTLEMQDQITSSMGM